MARLEQHAQHLAPQAAGGHALEELDLTTIGLGLISGVGLFEGLTKEVVQVRTGRRREQGPVTVLCHPLHEQVGDPVRRVHVMGATAVVTGVLAKLQEFLDVQVPGLQIGAHRALALAPLVDRHRRIVDDLQERHHALALAVGALDVGPQRAHACPVVAQTTGKLGQQRVFLQRLVNAIQIVRYRGEIATGQLGTPGAGIEQRGRAGHEIETRQHLIELDGPRLAVDLVQRQAHGHPHEEGLGHLDALLVDVQEVAVVQGLQAQVIELQVTLRLQGGGQAREIELEQLVIEQFGLDALLHEAREVAGVGHGHVGGIHLGTHNLAPDGVHQQARRGTGVGRLALKQGACGQDGGLVDLVDGHAVVQVAHGLGQDRLGRHVDPQIFAGLLHQMRQRGDVEGHPLAPVGDMELRHPGFGRCRLPRAFLGPAVPVQDVGPGHLVMPAAHQAQFHLVLHILDMERTATRARAQQRAHHGLREPVDRLAHAGGRSALGAMHRQEGLHQRHRNLAGLEGDDCAVAADDLVGRVGRCRRGGHGTCGHRHKGFLAGKDN